jgi:exodeoxyribonuclease V alpha subunit
MVDLALMRRLLDALRPETRVIMLGDPDQLAAVEAGGVLVDLCRAAERPGSELAGCVSRLRQSYRYAEGSGVARLAQAVHTQDADAALQLLGQNLEDVTFSADPNPRRREAALSELARKGYAGLRSSERDERLAALDRFRVLAAHRRGPSGVAMLSPLLARAVHGARTQSEHYAGRPLLITQNDYASALFNGDVGVEHPQRRSGPLCAYFRDEAGAIRELSLSRLPPHESVYAMTVHKSQGSEFDQVAVVLPEVCSPLVTRELLFTAITRARQSVHLFGSPGVLRAALAQRSDRFSGLADRL